MGKIALNYIYLSPKHAGGKDQVGLNLLKGFQENDYAKDMCIICFDYSVETIKRISKDIEIIALKATKTNSELHRMWKIFYTNTFIIPFIIKRNNIDLLYHLSYNTGLIKHKIKTIVIPHDIKAIAHRKLADVTIPFYKFWMYKLLYYIDFKNNDGIIAITCE